MPLYQLGSKKPRVHPMAMVAPNASIIGDVVVGSRTSIWPGAVLRGDYGRIRVGANCSLQDNVVVHCSAENAGVIGNELQSLTARLFMPAESATNASSEPEPSFSMGRKSALTL